MLSIAPPSVGSRPATSIPHAAPRNVASGRAPLAQINTIRNTPASASQQARATALAPQIFPELSLSKEASTEARVIQLLKGANGHPPDQATGTPRAATSQPASVAPSSPTRELPAAPRPVTEAQRQRAERLAAAIFGSTLDGRGFNGRGSGNAADTAPMFHCLMRDPPAAIPTPRTAPAAARAEAGGTMASASPRPQRST